MIEITTVILLGLIFSYSLSGLESAVLSVSHARLRHSAKEGGWVATVLRRAFENPQHLLISILVLNSAVNLLIFALVTRLFVDWMGSWGYLVSVVVSLPIVILWVEILPKAHFRRAPLQMLRRGVGLIWLLDWTLRPVVALLGWAASPLLKRSDTREQRAESREAFRDLTRLFERDGVLNHEETAIIRSVLDFHRVRVRDVMRPMDLVTGALESTCVRGILEISSESGFDQFPLLAKNGEVLGIIDVTSILLKDPELEAPVSRFKAEIVSTHPEETAINVVKKLRRAGIQLAVVRDSNNRPMGVVSVADMTAQMVRIEE